MSAIEALRARVAALDEKVQIEESLVAQASLKLATARARRDEAVLALGLVEANRLGLRMNGAAHEPKRRNIRQAIYQAVVQSGSTGMSSEELQAKLAIRGRSVETAASWFVGRHELAQNGERLYPPPAAPQLS